MFDVVIRACKHPFSYSGVLKKRTLIFKEKIQESENIYSFIFEPAKPCTWWAGEHAIFALPGKNVQGKTWRPFSVASAPHESVIRIGTIITDQPSDFKKKLSELQLGEKINMYGPYGEFRIKQHMKQIVGVAGGIGITPFRSIISDLTHQQSNTKLTLIYSAKPGQHTFKTDLDKWAQQNPNINIIYTHTVDEVNATLDEQVNVHGNRASYFISGSPGMISAIKNALKQKGIKKIVNDPFKGY